VKCSNKCTKESCFWNKCPLKLELIPNTPCSEGKPILDKKNRLLEEPKCPWWVNSVEDCYCFWRYIQNHSDADGGLKETSQGEIAKLFACSPTRIHFQTKDAMAALVEICKAQELHNLKDDGSEEVYSILDALADLLETKDTPPSEEN